MVGWCVLQSPASFAQPFRSGGLDLLRFTRHSLRPSACLTLLTALLLFGLMTAQSSGKAAAQSPGALVSAELRHAFGLLGPLPLNAAAVSEDALGAVMADASLFGVPLGDLSLDAVPLGEGLWAVQSREWTAAGGGNPGVGLWQLQGTWDQSLSGYQQLDYRAQDWRLLTSAGHSIAIADLSMIASPDGYRLQARDVEISGGSPAEAEGEPDTTFRYVIGDVLYESQWQGGAPGAAYASLGRAFDFRFLGASQDGGEALIGATLAHLQSLYLPATSSATTLEIRDMSLSLGSLGLNLQVDHLSLPATSSGEGQKTQALQLVMEGLDIQRREDYARLGQAQLGIDVSAADVAGFTAALAALFTDAEPGSSWQVLADIFLFFDNLQVDGMAREMVFALPDRMFSVSMNDVVGRLQLSDMRMDGATMTVQVRSDGITLDAIETPDGVQPDPIVIPAVIPVLGGRLVRFDPLSQSLVPSQLTTTVEITALPMANLRDTLGSLPRAGSFGDPGTLFRSLAAGAFGMITPFLIQPPIITIKDTAASAADYTMRLEGSHQVMPIPPLFGFGTFLVEISGLDAVQQRSSQTAAAAAAINGEDVQGMQDYSGQIADWASRLGAYGDVTGNDQRRYALELSQLGEVVLNGTVIAPQ